jgi:transposase-like protein
MEPISYARHRFPPVIIQHAVWLYFRFTLSYRDVEDILAERGIDVSYETIRRWVEKFGRQYAKRLRIKRPKPSFTWHIDEVFLKIGGKQMYLWRAIDDEGEVLDVLLQSRRNKPAALKFLRRTLKAHQTTPRTVVTDKWQASMSAVRDVLPSTANVVGKRLNNRIENSHQPTRRRERKLQRFKTAKSAQRFLATFTAFYNQFNIQRHLISRSTMKRFRSAASSSWTAAITS